MVYIYIYLYFCYFEIERLERFSAWSAGREKHWGICVLNRRRWVKELVEERGRENIKRPEYGRDFFPVFLAAEKQGGFLREALMYTKGECHVITSKACKNQKPCFQTTISYLFFIPIFFKFFPRNVVFCFSAFWHGHESSPPRASCVLQMAGDISLSYMIQHGLCVSSRAESAKAFQWIKLIR